MNNISFISNSSVVVETNRVTVHNWKDISIKLDDINVVSCISENGLSSQTFFHSLSEQSNVINLSVEFNLNFTFTKRRALTACNRLS